MGQLEHFLQQSETRQALAKMIYVGFVLVLLLFLATTLDRRPENPKSATSGGFDEQSPDRFVEIYKDFEIVQSDGRYYALTTPADLTNRETLTISQANNYGGITSIGLEEVKQLIDILTSDRPDSTDLLDLSQSSLPDNLADLLDLTSLIKTIEASSSYPPYGPELLLDGGSANIHAWHSEEEATYPQWIDIVFDQPIHLEGIGLQAQVGSASRAPRSALILRGEDFDSHPTVSVAFNFISDGGWSYHRLPKLGAFQQYRILILDNQGDPQFASIQEMQFYGQVDEPVLMAENYKGFDIFRYENKFYALDRTLESMDLTQLDEAQLKKYQAVCAESNQCAIADSLEAAKQLVDQLH